MRRAIAAVAGAALLSIALVGSAHAANPTGYCSKSRGLPGSRLVVKGQDGQPGEFLHLLFNSKTIGGNTVDGFGFWRVGGTIPRHATPGTYQISVTFQTSATATPCMFRVVRSS